MRKTVAAAVMAASITVGGAAGAALFVPSLSGAQTDDTTTEESTETDERSGFLADALAPLVSDGTITQPQADAVIERLREARPEGHRHRGGHLFGGALTEVLGIDAEALRAALEDGQTIAEIAEANGVDVDDVIETLVAAAEERIDQGVEDGRLTEEEAADKLADATEHITALVNGEVEPGGPGHRGGFGHRGPGGAAPPEEPTDDSTGS